MKGVVASPVLIVNAKPVADLQHVVLRHGKVPLVEEPVQVGT
jgi:hypothetical protein